MVGYSGVWKKERTGEKKRELKGVLERFKKKEGEPLPQVKRKRRRATRIGRLVLASKESESGETAK